MSTATATKSFFSKHFDRIEKVLPYNSGWENGTGYCDFAVTGKEAPILSLGGEAKSSTLTGRDIIFIGTPFGNCVIFKRYTDSDVVVSNLPQQVTDLYMGTSVGTSLDNITLHLLLGNPDCPKISPNVGVRMKNIYAEFNKINLKHWNK